MDVLDILLSQGVQNCHHQPKVGELFRINEQDELRLDNETPASSAELAGVSPGKER
jgi:hypothetical protein